MKWFEAKEVSSHEYKGVYYYIKSSHLDVFTVLWLFVNCLMIVL